MKTPLVDAEVAAQGSVGQLSGSPKWLDSHFEIAAEKNQIRTGTHYKWEKPESVIVLMAASPTCGRDYYVKCVAIWGSLR